LKLLLASGGLEVGWRAGADAIDHQTAIKVADDGVEVISERQWRRFERESVNLGGKQR
jgi:hypothetical protein